MRHLLLLGALLALVTAPARAENWYAVEVIVFVNDNPGDRNSETWPSTTVLPETRRAEALSPASGAPTAPFQRLPPEQHKLTSVYHKLARNGNYRPVWHEAWVQPGYPRRSARPVLVEAEVAPGNGGKSGKLIGRLALGKGSYLHLQTALRYRELRDARDAAPAPADTPFDFEQAFGNTGGFDPTPDYAWFELDQNRRIPLNDIIYVDHPVVGVLAQVRRYQKP